ncbi:hypothetical protein GALMADRAFT_148987 [Galerina marginata CBS 339.88]|uniref:Uncharacterized protein n=1 Tax=Galerina marginata (strain CBS 339.88) TaxID=685588 RepID=A0A067S2R1_GALM3|nr:hypothetical protein GALMADRAFT_148987 [Galerina marginata CBS 339.88]
MLTDNDMDIQTEIQIAALSNRKPTQHILDAAQDKIVKLNTDIEEMKTMSDEAARQADHFIHLNFKLTHQLKILEKQNYLLKSLYAPYRNIPTELISEIFLWVLPLLVDQADLCIWLQALDIFTHVCSEWKSIALNDPRIWKNLYVMVRPKQQKLACNIIKRWTKCMSNNNLHLTLDIAGPLISIPGIFKVYQTLNNCEQIVNLRLIMEDGYNLSHSNMLSQQKLPSLTHLAIAERNRILRSLPAFVKADAYKTPKLTHLEIRVAHGYIVHSKILGRITCLHLHLHTYNMKDFTDILKYCTKLVECKLTFDIKLNKPVLHTTDKIEFPHLTTLIVDAREDMSGLLCLLNAPKLITIHISRNSSKPSLKADMIKPFIEINELIRYVHFTGFNILNDRDRIDPLFQQLYPKITVTWENTPIIPKDPIFYEIPDSEEEREYNQNASPADSGIESEEI